jgi:hypothetical protein
MRKKLAAVLVVAIVAGLFAATMIAITFTTQLPTAAPATSAPPTPTAPAVFPTPVPVVAPKAFDERTEGYVELLDRTPTGSLVVQFLRSAPITISWVTFDPEIGYDGLATPGGEIWLASNLLADPTAGSVAWADLAYGSSVIAHEALHAAGRDPDVDRDETGEALEEQRATLAEVKVVCELLASYEERGVDYDRCLAEVAPFYPDFPARPWDTESLTPAPGEAMDDDLLRRLLYWPKPATVPALTPTSEMTKTVVGLAMTRQH